MAAFVQFMLRRNYPASEFTDPPVEDWVSYLRRTGRIDQKGKRIK